MHLYYNAQDKTDVAKLGELMSLEALQRQGSEDKSEPYQPDRRRRRAHFIFQTVNTVNGVIGLTFFTVGLVMYIYCNSGTTFGWRAYHLVAFFLGICGLAQFLLSAAGLFVDTGTSHQLLLYVIGSGALLFLMVLVTAAKLPNTKELLVDVSSEMTESLHALKKGDTSQRSKWDKMHQSMHCCGVMGYLDWCNTLKENVTVNSGARHCDIPTSCFSSVETNILSMMRPVLSPGTAVFAKGCYHSQMSNLATNINLLHSFGYLMFSFSVFSTIFAGFLLFSLRSGE